MTWVKLDDSFPSNPKVLAATKDARLLYIAGLCYCAQQLTDGLIPTAQLPALAAQSAVKTSAAASLVDVGLWEKTEDGYVVHDFLVYNRSRASVQAERERWRNYKQPRSAVESAVESNMDSAVDSAPSAGTPSRPVPSRPVLSKQVSQSTTGRRAPNADDQTICEPCRNAAAIEAGQHNDIRNMPAWVNARAKTIHATAHPTTTAPVDAELAQAKSLGAAMARAGHSIHDLRDLIHDQPEVHQHAALNAYSAIAPPPLTIVSDT